MLIGGMVLAVLAMTAVLVWYFVIRTPEGESGGGDVPGAATRPKMDVEYVARNDTGTSSESGRTINHTGSSSSPAPLTLLKVNTVDSKDWKVTSGGSMKIADTFDPGASFTVLVWVKPDPSAGLKCLVSNSAGGFATDGIRIYWNMFTEDGTGNDRSLYIESGDGAAGSLVNSEVTMVPGEWRMVAVTVDRVNSVLMIYSDGEQRGEPRDIRFTKTSGPWTFGALNMDGEFGRAVDSLFGRMGISNSILTPAQIKEQYEMTKGDFV